MKIKFDRISASPLCYYNISSLTWENAGYKQKRGYKFTYDRLNRMANAAYGERDDLSDNAGHYDETLEYDTNGNITGLQRSGLKQDGQYGNIDNLHLSYNGNQLVMIKEDAEPILNKGAFNLSEKGEHRLAYNGCGALQSDETRGIAMIEYDGCNNPRRIQFTNGNVTKYVYTPDGRKLRTIHHTAMPNIKVEVGQVHPLTAGEILSSDSIDYMMGGKLITKNGRIDKYLFEGGYCQAIGGQTHLTRPPLILWDDEDSNPSPSDYEQWRKTFESWEAAMKAERERDQFLFYYYNRDHLGNIREVVDDNGNVVQVNNYYPFGSPYCDTSASKAPELQPYKYNGKELDLMHGLNTYDYGARQYNPVVPIWDRVDPLCEKYYNTSPYAYCGNNPVSSIDLDGRDWYQNNKTLYYTWYNEDTERKGFTHIGGKGSVLGEFEGIIDNILSGKDGLGLESLYSNGFTFDIAPKDKGGLIGSKERGWDFFDEFVNGTGPEFSVLPGDHPYTEAVKDEEFVKESQNTIRLRGKNGKYTNAGRPGFFPWQANPTSPMQFIGTYRYDGYSSKDGRYIYNVVTDSKSVTSLGYHIPFLNNHRRHQSREFGTTYQFYIWRSKK
ncbi:RHS repeat domain-containing protein [Segatella buccae]|uniref:RHS repeat domain-containing protein n=1 Tax=Segatella buccae TaxID=28126 RepID=UPI0027B88EEA|nr:RHS repeat-associated core domain-containing protein [Segatella buccae]